MAISSTDKELLKYLTLMAEPQKKSLLELIKTFLKPSEEPRENADTIKQYNKELDEAMGRIAKGEFTTLEELEREIQSW